MTGTWTLAAGEHVCWRASSDREYAVGRAELAARADRNAGGLLILGNEPDDRRQPSVAPQVTLPEARERVLRARRNDHGRTPWVLAPMNDLAPPHTEAADMVAIELELAELAAQAETAVVCAYHGGSWGPETLGAVSALHSRVMGADPRLSGFRLRANGAGYLLEGSVGFDSLSAFTATLHGALIRSPQLRLSCRELDLFEAVAMRALVETVAARPGCSIVLEHTSQTIRRTWDLSGYGSTGIDVRVAP